MRILIQGVDKNLKILQLEKSFFSLKTHVLFISRPPEGYLNYREPFSKNIKHFKT
jgi:hypothetical protein